MANEVVPFGKYKGQPLEVLLADTQYMTWLSEQPWVKERYPVVQTLIINNFGEPDETPEHNAFQGSFYDDEYMYMFLKHLIALNGHSIVEIVSIAQRTLGDIESKIADGYTNFPHRDYDKHGELHDFELRRRVIGLGCYHPELKTCLDRLQDFLNQQYQCGIDISEHASVESEVYGWDLKIVINDGLFSYASPDKPYIYIELKPEIGDDFPAILRQMKNNVERAVKKLEDEYEREECSFMVVYRSYTGCGVTEKIMRKQFENSGFQIVREDEFFNKCEGID